MGKRFKKRFRNICCLGKTSSDSETEDEVVGERKTAKEVEAGKVKTKPRKMSEKEALLQKLDEMYQFLTKALSNIYALFEDNKCFNEEIMNRHFVRVDNVDDAPSLISVDIKGSDDQSQRVSNKSSMGCKQLERYKKGTVVQGQSNVYHGKDTYTTLDKNLLRDNIHFNRRNPLKVHFDCQQKEITSKSDIEKNLCLNSTNDKQHDASRSRTELPKAGPIESLERNERSYTLPRYLRINPESFSQQCKRRRSTLGFIDIANQLKASLKASDDDISNDSATADSALESKHLSEEPVKSMELLSSRTRSVLNYLRDRVHSEDSIGKDSGLDFKKEVDRNFVTKTQICQLGSKGSMSKIPHEFFGKKKSADFAPFLGVQFNIEGCKEVSDINNIRGLSTSFNWSDDRIKSGNDLASMYSQITAERLRSMAINNAIALYNGSAFVTQHRANPIAMVNDLNTMHCCIPSLFLSCRNALMPRFLASHEVKPPWHRPWNSSYSATLARIDTTTTIETPDMTKIPATTWKIDPNKIYMNQLLTATLDVTLFIVRQVRGILLVRPLNTTFSLDEHGMESASNILSGIMEKSVHRIETGSLIPSEKKEMMKNDDYQASCFAGSILTDAPAQGNSAVILAVLPLRFICMKLFFFPVRHIENNIEHHELTITLTQLGLLYRNLASKNVKSGMHKAKARDTTIKPLKNLCGQLFVVNTVAFLDKDDENKSDSSDRNTSISFDDDVKAPNQLVATADVLGKTEFEGVPLSRISMTITLRDLMDNTGISHQFTEVHAKFLCINLLRCLKDLHSEGKIHRSISQRNVVLDPLGYPYLVGYENSPAVEFDSPEVKSIPLMEYVTPEYITSGPVTDATDVFQIGVLVYHLLYGKLPHQGSTDPETRENLLNENFTPKFTSGTLTKDGRYFIRKCLRKDPDSRFKLKNCTKQLEKAVRWFQSFNSEELANQTSPSPFKDLVVQKTTTGGCKNVINYFTQL